MSSFFDLFSQHWFKQSLYACIHAPNSSSVISWFDLVYDGFLSGSIAPFPAKAYLCLMQCAGRCAIKGLIYIWLLFTEHFQRRACDKLGKQGKPLPAPQKLPVGKQSPVKNGKGLPLEAIGMVTLPKDKTGNLIHWDNSILEAWDISESAAMNRLEEFASEGIPHPTTRSLQKLILESCFMWVQE